MLEDQTIDAPPASVAAKRTNAVPRERASASTVIKSAEHEGRAVGATVADSRSMTALGRARRGRGRCHAASCSSGVSAHKRQNG